MLANDNGAACTLPNARGWPPELPEAFENVIGLGAPALALAYPKPNGFISAGFCVMSTVPK